LFRETSYTAQQLKDTIFTVIAKWHADVLFLDRSKNNFAELKIQIFAGPT
jgi:hypothetical protein